MSDQQPDKTKRPLVKAITIVSVVVTVILIIGPRGAEWLNEQSLFWKIAHPLMTLVYSISAYKAFRSKAMILTRLGFIAAVIWTGCQSLIINEILVVPILADLAFLGEFAFMILMTFSYIDSFLEKLGT